MTGKTTSTRAGWFRLRFSWVLALVLVALAGCQQLGCDAKKFGPTGDIPDSPEKRLEGLASQVPGSAQVSALISDTAAVRKTIEQARADKGGPLPVLDEMEANFKKRTGIELFSAKSWKDAGLAADGAAGLTTMTGRPIMLVYIKDQKKFEKHFTTQAESELDVSGPAKLETVGNTKMKVMGDDEHQRVAWGYAGRLAVITIPPNQNAVEEKTPTATGALETILTLKSEDSMRDTSGFEKFRDAVSKDHNFMIYADSDAAIDEGALSGAAKRVASASGQSTEDLKKQLDGVGLVFSLEESRVRGRMWIGMSDKTAGQIRSIYTTGPEVDWSNFGTENTLLAVRLASKWSEFWKNYLNGLSDKRRRNVQNQIKRLGEAVGINAEKDLIGNFSGQMALFVYGATKEFNPGAVTRNPLGSLDQIGAILAAQVDNGELLRNTLQTVTSKVGSIVVLETVGEKEIGASDAVHVVSFQKPKEDGGILAMLMKEPPPIRIYAYKKQMAIATTAIDPKPMAKYLKGERGEASLADLESLDLGGKFVTDNQVTGLYINFVRVRNHVIDKLPPIPQFRNALTALEEVMLDFVPKEKGAFVNVTVDVSDSGSGKQGSGTSKKQAESDSDKSGEGSQQDGSKSAEGDNESEKGAGESGDEQSGKKGASE